MLGAKVVILPFFSFFLGINNDFSSTFCKFLEHYCLSVYYLNNTSFYG